MNTRRLPLVTAACTACLGLALSLGAPAAGAQASPGVSIGSIGATSVGAAAQADLG